MSDTSILDLNLKDAPDMKVLPDGEYELQVTDVNVQDAGLENNRLSVRCEAIGEPEAYDIYHTLWLPHESKTPKQNNGSLDRIKKFVTAIGLDANVKKIDFSEWNGCRFWAALKTDTNYDKNIIKSLSRTK